MLKSANRGAAVYVPRLVTRPRSWCQRLRRTVPFPLGAAALVAVAVGAHHRPLDARGLVPSRASGPDGVHFRAVVIAQRADCTGNMGHLAFLERTGVASAVLQRHLLIAGNGRDTVGLRALLPRALQHATIDPLDDAQRTLLAALGHHATPVIALFDGHDRLLILSATPDDPMQRTVFVRAVARLLTNNPAP